MDIMSLLMAKRAGGNTPSGGGVNSVNGVKPDGAGNVALKYDDLENRPFGETTVMGDTLEWDGNTEGLVSVGGLLYKVSDAVFTADELTEASVIMSNGMVLDAEQMMVFGDLIVIGEAFCSIVPESVVGTETPIGFVFEETGVYFLTDGKIYTTSLTVPGYGKFETTEIKPLDPKFLPEGARAYKAVEVVRFVDNKSRTSELDSTYGAYAVNLGNIIGGMYRTEPCTIAWDGTTKTHNPVDMELMGMKFTAYGNVGMFAAFGVPGENTGEPYVLVFMENGYSFFFTADQSATTHNISVTGKAIVYHPVEQGFVEVPTLDFVKMGLPSVGGADVDFPCDVTALNDVLMKNSLVKVRYIRDQGSDAHEIEHVATALVSCDVRAAIWHLIVYEAGNMMRSFRVDRNGIYVCRYGF